MKVEMDGGIQNTLCKFSEDFADYYETYKIRVYMDILDSDYVDQDIKEKTKKQLNKEIMKMLVFEEEYDEWFKENML